MADVMEPDTIQSPEPDISHLVTEDDTPVDNIFSEKQQRLLTESLYASWGGPPGEEKRPFVALANVGFFYSVGEPPAVPDVLLSLDVSLPEELWEKQHRSYFIWEYGKPPEVVIEIVSNRKGGELDSKRRKYARFGIAYYVVFDPATLLSNNVLQLFELWRLAYIPQEDYWLSEVGLGLVLWEGEYEGHFAQWLRWVDQDGELILTGAERAKEAHERAERLAAQLRALGVEPEE
jgi:hypothetical protein